MELFGKTRVSFRGYDQKSNLYIRQEKNSIDISRIYLMKNREILKE